MHATIVHWNELTTQWEILLIATRTQATELDSKRRGDVLKQVSETRRVEVLAELTRLEELR